MVKDQQINIRLTDEEFDMIKSRMKKSNFTSMH